MIIDSRLGKKEIDESKVVLFPRGIIGFEGLQQFVLLRISDNSPFFVLQSIENPAMGLLVAEPANFVINYTPQLNEASKLVLKAESTEGLIILVSASIPPGKPEETTLNLLGPFIINQDHKVGIQVPQVEGNTDAHAKIYKKEKE